jgi:hypothetical protein
MDAASDAATDAAIDATDQLPAPEPDTVEMRLNGMSATLVRKEFCMDGNVGIGFEHSADPGNSNPTLFLHQIDLSATGHVTIHQGTPWHLDIDDTVGVWGATPAGCDAMVIANTATEFELQALDCAIATQFGTAMTGVVSFRVRCTKESSPP